MEGLNRDAGCDLRGWQARSTVRATGAPPQAGARLVALAPFRYFVSVVASPKFPRTRTDPCHDRTRHRREKFRRRLPKWLDELHGPAEGVVELPLPVAWSGMTTYDMDKPRQRMGLYRTVLHEGLSDDLPLYLNQDLLLQMWPVLRTLVGRTVRTVWEDAFPGLAAHTRAAA